MKIRHYLKAKANKDIIISVGGESLGTIKVGITTFIIRKGSDLELADDNRNFIGRHSFFIGMSTCGVAVAFPFKKHAADIDLKDLSLIFGIVN